MRTLLFLLQKEFRQIFRNPTILRMMIVVPIMQLLILPMASDYEIKNINVAIVDHDHSSYSQQLVSKIIESGYFRLSDFGESFPQAYEGFEKDKSDLILEIPKDFEKDMTVDKKASLFLAANSINGTKANIGSSYLGRIINDYNMDIRLKWMTPTKFNPVQVVEVSTLNWFNPFQNYKFFMVPGILVILVTMVGAYMCALNIVKEKEVGTIEQINVTPIKKHLFILGKLIPFWVLGMIIFSIGLLIIARFVYGIVPVGSLLLLYGFLAIYLVAVLGIGLLISTYSTTQQQAMSLAFFCMMIFMLMGGLFTSIDSMPEWAKWISRFNPVTYFIEVVRMVILKCSTFSDIKSHFLIVGLFALVFNGWAVLNYRKTS